MKRLQAFHLLEAGWYGKSYLRSEKMAIPRLTCVARTVTNVVVAVVADVTHSSQHCSKIGLSCNCFGLQGVP